MTLQLLQADDSTPVLDLLSQAEAGQESPTMELHLWNHPGDPSGQEVRNVLAAIRTESPAAPGVWVATGVPPQDELWWRLRITGFDNRGDAPWTIAPTDWRPLGAFSTLEISRIPPDCAVHLEARQHPPSTAEATTWRHKLVFFYNEYAQPIPHALGLLRRGVLTRLGHLEHSALVSGCEVSVSDPPDPVVRTAAGLWVHRGHLYGKVSEEHSFDLVDGDGQALGDGESYYAALTLNGDGVRVTRGSRGIVPQKPSVEATDIFLRWVRVEHDVSGAPLIDTGDLEGEALYDRFHLEVGNGLEARLHPGQAIGAFTWRYRAHATPLVFAADVTSYVWLLASGKPTVTLDAVAPESSALLLWEVETDAVAIVATRDHRSYATPSRVLTLSGELPQMPGLIDRRTVVDDRLFLEEVVIDVLDLGGGTTGVTVFDVLVNGSSIYPSSGVDDQRPRFAFDAVERTHRGSVPERLELRRGDEIRLVTVAQADAAPSRAVAQLRAWIMT